MIETWYMDKGKLQEAITTLYLRLNGYFTSGLIVHRPAKGNLTDVDVLAVRFPWHVQPDRGVGPASELKCTGTEVDIIIGEVKSVGQRLQFNRSLRDSPEGIRRILQWIGAFEQPEIADLEPLVHSALMPEAMLTLDPPTVLGPRNIRIRGMLFSPESDVRRPNQPWFLPGPPIFDYLWGCLHPETPRPSCATQYDFGLWGQELEPLVRYVKDSAKPTTFGSFFDDFRKWADQINGGATMVSSQP